MNLATTSASWAHLTQPTKRLAYCLHTKHTKNASSTAERTNPGHTREENNIRQLSGSVGGNEPALATVISSAAFLASSVCRRLSSTRWRAASAANLTASSMLRLSLHAAAASTRPPTKASPAPLALTAAPSPTAKAAALTSRPAHAETCLARPGDAASLSASLVTAVKEPLAPAVIATTATPLLRNHSASARRRASPSPVSKGPTIASASSRLAWRMSTKGYAFSRTAA
ncbi:unnamed protein product [Ectocarpus sp. 12 AP-2014]